MNQVKNSLVKIENSEKWYQNLILVRTPPPPHHPTPNSLQVDFTHVTSGRARGLRYRHERRWNVNLAVGRVNLGEGRGQICYFTGIYKPRLRVVVT